MINNVQGDIRERVVGKCRVVSVTVNNNGCGSGNVSGQSVQARTTGTNPLTVSSGTSNPPAKILLPNCTTTALLQAYLTLNNLIRIGSDNSMPNATITALSHPEANKSLSNARPVAVTRYDFCVKVINPGKKSDFSTYVLRDVVREIPQTT